MRDVSDRVGTEERNEDCGAIAGAARAVFTKKHGLDPVALLPEAADGVKQRPPRRRHSNDRRKP